MSPSAQTWVNTVQMQLCGWNMSNSFFRRVIPPGEFWKFSLSEHVVQNIWLLRPRTAEFFSIYMCVLFFLRWPYALSFPCTCWRHCSLHRYLVSERIERKQCCEGGMMGYTPLQEMNGEQGWSCSWVFASRKLFGCPNGLVQEKIKLIDYVGESTDSTLAPCIGTQLDLGRKLVDQGPLVTPHPLIPRMVSFPFGIFSSLDFRYKHTMSLCQLTIALYPEVLLP